MLHGRKQRKIAEAIAVMARSLASFARKTLAAFCYDCSSLFCLKCSVDWAEIAAGVKLVAAGMRLFIGRVNMFLAEMGSTHITALLCIRFL